MALAHSIFWNTTQGGVVAVTDILRKREVYQPVNQFLDIHFVIGPVEINT
jgi:hypothetical protein